MHWRGWIGAMLCLLGVGYALHLRAAGRGPLANPTARQAAAEPPRIVQAARGAHAAPLEGAEPPVFVVRGGEAAGGRLVFLHGMCGHGLGYAQAFQYAAAKKGTLIAPQADEICGEGPWAKWSMDVGALDERIQRAFRQLGHESPLSDICVLGVSQGATRAAELARRYPERYRTLVSIGAPTAVKPTGLERLRAAVFMVGQRERKDLMLASEQALRRSGVPAKSVVIPDADHADLGKTPEATMGAVLDWLWAASAPAGHAPPN